MNRSRRPPRTLHTRLLTLLVALFLPATASITLLFAHHSGRTYLDTEQRLGAGLAETFAMAARDPASRADLYTDRGYAAHLIENPAIAGVSIIVAGNILYERRRETGVCSWFTRVLLGSGAQTRHLVAAIPGEAGRVELRLANQPLNQAVTSVLIKGSAVAAIWLMLAVYLANHWFGRLGRTLQPLTEWAREFSRGNWRPTVKLAEDGPREICELNQAFTDGSTALQHYVTSLSEAQELLEHNETRMRKLIDGMHEILFELNTEGRLVFLNPAWEKLTGFRINESLGKALADFFLDEDVAHELIRDPAAIRDHGREIELRTAAGSRLCVSMDADAQFDASGNFCGVIGTLANITHGVEMNHQLRQYQNELYHLSVTDPLTGLFNRRHFDTQLEKILDGHLAEGQPVCLLLVNLDGFKFINDTYGHPFGDEVLRTMTRLLADQVRRNDYLARPAGDEFAMVLKNTDLENATRIAQKLLVRINRTRVPLPVGSMQLQVSIGVAEAPTHGKNAQELVTAADMALYHSKRHGRNRVEALSTDVSRAMMSMFSQGFQLRHALDHDQIHPAFQPICRLRDDQPMAYEVLARMTLNGALVPAKDFISVAEELGLTRELDLHIIRRALAVTPVNVALFLNVDLSSFNESDFINELGQLLQPACAAGRSITIEITEREVIQLNPTLFQDVQRLREFGCKLALDDFGSGYSTYNFLNQFRPDYLKIEGSFVRGMLTNDADRKIVTHIHDLAVSFGMETIAESVEDASTRDAVRAIGISNAQGYFYGVPTLASANPDTQAAERLTQKNH